MKPNTLIERLRGLIRVPVNDGAGLLDGKDFFERQFPASKIALEAADRIEALENALREALAKCTEHYGDAERMARVCCYCDAALACARCGREQPSGAAQAAEQDK